MLYDAALVIYVRSVQVAKTNMQQQLADMTAQLQKVESEHEQLTGRSAMLEKVLHSHQQQLNILHDQQQVPGLSACCLRVYHVYIDSMSHLVKACYS